VALAVMDFWLMMPLMTLAYLCTSPLSWGSHRRLVRPSGGAVRSAEDPRPLAPGL